MSDMSLRTDRMSGYWASAEYPPEVHGVYVVFFLAPEHGEPVSVEWVERWAYCPELHHWVPVEGSCYPPYRPVVPLFWRNI